MKYILPLLILIFMLPAHRASGQENPYLQFRNKPYKEYAAQLHNDYYYLPFKDSSQVMVDNIREAARAFGTREWALEVEFVEFSKKLADSHRAGYPEGSYSPADMVEDLIALEKKSASLSTPYLRLRLMYGIMNAYYLQLSNYEMAFRYAIHIDKLLESVNAEEFPFKPYYYLNIANLYYFFREYDSAQRFYEKVVENPDAAYRSNALEAAYNGMGLIVANEARNFVRSDSCYTKILDTKSFVTDQASARRYDQWTGIAKGNLGNNAYLRGEYDAAIPMLEFSMQRMIEYVDYNYASGKAGLLADIFIQKGDLIKAKYYVDLTCDYIKKTVPESNKPYSLLSRYSAAVGDYKQAMIYADSAAIENERYSERFSALKLYRADQRAKLEELEIERMRKDNYRKVAILLFVGLVLISLLSLLLYSFYRRKRAAYRELVRKGQQWANIQTDDIDQSKEEGNEAGGMPETSDLELMKLVELNIRENKRFKDSDLTLDKLASELGVLRKNLSRAINLCTGKNFNNYINEYRVKEAIRLLSVSDSNKLSIDGIAFDSGFNDRKSFYRVFKKITGLSPSDFRNNLNQA